MVKVKVVGGPRNSGWRDEYMHAGLLANGGGGRGATTASGVGHRDNTCLEKALESAPSPRRPRMSVTRVRISALSRSASPGITHPFTMLTGNRGAVQFFFSFPLFAFQLIEQMEILFLNYSVSPFDLSTSGRRLFGYICFLKMRVKTDMELGAGFLSFVSSPACPINIVSQEKQRNKLLQH